MIAPLEVNLNKTTWSPLGHGPLLMYKVWSEWITHLLRYALISCLVSTVNVELVLV